MRAAALAWCYAWAGPTTLFGVLAVLAALVTGGRARCVRGVLEVRGGAVTWLLRRLRASAMTLGHVVLAVDAAAHARSRAHERVHVRQCELWGPMFLPAYAMASLLAWLRGRHYYYDNAFERQAYDHDRARREDGRGREPA